MFFLCDLINEPWSATMLDFFVCICFYTYNRTWIPHSYVKFGEYKYI